METQEVESAVAESHTVVAVVRSHADINAGVVRSADSTGVVRDVQSVAGIVESVALVVSTAQD